MKKNVAGQISTFPVVTINGVGVVDDVDFTFELVINSTPTAPTGTLLSFGDGFWVYLWEQAETNNTTIGLKCSGSGILTVEREYTPSEHSIDDIFNFAPIVEDSEDFVLDENGNPLLDEDGNPIPKGLIRFIHAGYQLAARHSGYQLATRHSGYTIQK